VIIHPDQRDTENNVEGKDDPIHFHKGPERRLFKKVATTEKVARHEANENGFHRHSKSK
jgi:hypothetical protein